MKKTRDRCATPRSCGTFRWHRTAHSAALRHGRATPRYFCAIELQHDRCTRANGMEVACTMEKSFVAEAESITKKIRDGEIAISLARRWFVLHLQVCCCVHVKKNTSSMRKHIRGTLRILRTLIPDHEKTSNISLYSNHHPNTIPNPTPTHHKNVYAYTRTNMPEDCNHLQASQV